MHLFNSSIIKKRTLFFFKSLFLETIFDDLLYFFITPLCSSPVDSCKPTSKLDRQFRNSAAQIALTPLSFRLPVLNRCTFSMQPCSCTLRFRVTVELSRLACSEFGIFRGLPPRTCPISCRP